MTSFELMILVQLLLILSINSLSGATNLNLRHGRNLDAQNYHAIVSNYNNNQRPSQLITTSQQVLTGTHSRAAGLILPANNQIETSNFKESYYNHPARYHQPSVTLSGKAPYMGMLTSPAFSLSSPQINDNDQVSSAIQIATTATAATNNNPSIQRPQLTFAINNQTTDLSDSHREDKNLELALRQANSDESIFQPSPALIVPSEHGFDPWLAVPHQPVSSTKTSGSTANATNSQSTSATTTTTTAATTPTTTTDQSNNIISSGHNLGDYGGASNAQPASVNSYDPMSSGNVAAIGHQHAMDEYERSGSSVNGANSTITTVELPNHVFYEGPATAPPAGNYYFSSSEKLPNSSERASNVWWLLGFGHEYERASNLTRDDYREYCSNSDLLVNNKQRSLCRLHPKIMSIVARGLKMAIDECQFRFSSNRWNCSLVLQNSLPATSFDQLQQQQSNQLFGDVMKQPNRERSFLNAIVGAGLAHAMTKACSQGELPEECNCDKKIKTKNNRGKIEWVACSDDIDYGARFSREFTDQSDNESDAVSMINVHNYEVGRRVFKSATDITCTCQNGENGLCQTKRCWKHLGSFTDIGDELIRRYESATHVQLSNKDPHKLRPVRRGVRKPKRKDLVYIDESPDYCSPNIRLGVLGTQNRRCNSTSMGSDSCSLLCCGRGYQVIVEEVEEDCNCKFVWCCQVKCEKCRRQLTNDVCN